MNLALPFAGAPDLGLRHGERLGRKQVLHPEDVGANTAASEQLGPLLLVIDMWHGTPALRADILPLGHH